MNSGCNGSADPVQVVATRQSNQLRRPNDVTVVDRKYIIAQQGSNPKNAGLRIFDSLTGSSSLILRNGPIGRPLGVTTDGTDYVVSSLLNNVNDGAFFRVSQAGTVTGSLLLPSDTRPFDIVYDSANDLFMATETISASIVVIDSAFTHAQIFPIPGLSRGSNAPAGITVQGPGDYIITDELTGELFRLQESSPGSAAIGQFNSLTTLASGLGVAVGITLDGNDYIVTDSNGRLLRVSGGSVAEIRSTTGLLGNPTGLTTLRSGNYLVLDYNGDRLLEITDCPD
ncbi:MAG: hypothetical protein HC921_08790 [Synechococcaceae cyanobacterium SM2_3_1]|nr:hypothetical protein [Synechococcaceae cyanobacterium SM2_3_1]